MTSEGSKGEVLDPGPRPHIFPFNSSELSGISVPSCSLAGIPPETMAGALMVSSPPAQKRPGGIGTISVCPGFSPRPHWSCLPAHHPWLLGPVIPSWHCPCQLHSKHPRHLSTVSTPEYQSPSTPHKRLRR